VICAKGTRFDNPIEIMEMRTHRDTREERRRDETKGIVGVKGRGKKGGRRRTRCRQERCKLP